MTIGELSFESSSSVCFTWTIPDFFRLAKESDHSLQSPDFTFADGRHCLRLFQARDSEGEWIGIEFMNSNDTDPGRAVSYEIEFKSRSEQTEFYRRVDDKKEFCLDRSDFECLRDEFVPDGTLTVLCSVRSREPDSAGSPGSGGAQPPVCPQRRMTGNLSSQSFPCLYVTWRIPAFFQPTRDSECTLESPEFPFSDRRYRLRLVQLKYVVEIHLVNLTDPVPGRFVSYEVGLKSTTREEIEIDSYGTSTEREFLISSSDLDAMQRVRFPDGHLTVFCCMHSREPSSDKEALPGCGPPFTVKSGELAFDSPLSLGVTWNITDFFQLTTESAYSLQCPDFTFSDGRYCLRLSSSGNDNDFVDLQLVNSTDTVFGRYVSYEVGLKSTTGEEIDIRHFGTSTTREFCIPRDELDKKISECFPDGHLTVFCCMRSREPNNAGSPNSGGAESHLFPGSKAAAHPKSVAVQTSNEEEDKKPLTGVYKLQYKSRYLVLAA